ncbi:MAG: hypothetical protein IJ272_02360 [Clostridia bacterium]|nr:hypothetical protein [Clostridia bacterium]
MNKKVFKILIIVSVVIVILGVISGISIKNELVEGGTPNNDVYIDGTNATPFIDAFAEIGADLLGVIVVVYTVLAVGSIWGIYGIISLIAIIVKKYKAKIKRTKN